MTSIASTSLQQFQSPLTLLQNELQSEVSAGTISSTDKQALSSALKDIDSALKSQAASGSPGSQPPSPSDITSKINDLIQSEVKNGKLTDSQASELKNIFANALQARGPGGPGGPEGPGRPGRPGRPDQQGQTSSSGTSTSSSSTTSSADQLLKDFLKLFKDAQSASSTYSSSGDTTGQSQTSSLLLNFQT